MNGLSIVVVTTLSLLAMLAWPAGCAAQMYRPDRNPPEGAPHMNLNLSRASVDALNAEFDDDFRTLDQVRALDAFAKKHSINPRLAPSVTQLYGEWKVYGRVYLVNFQHKLEENEDATRFTWRRSGPRIGGARIYILLHRVF